VAAVTGKPAARKPEQGDLAAAVAEAQAELEAAVERGGLRRDPLRFVLGALSATLGVFPEAVRRVEGVAEASRAPLSPKAEAELLRRFEEAARRGAASASPAVTRRTSALVGSALATAALAGAAAGWFAGRASVPAEVTVAERGLRMSLGAAEAWLPILRANPDPRPLVARGRVFRDERTGWRVGTVTLYLEPGDAAPQQARR
jgi:hypothetical protein